MAWHHTCVIEGFLNVAPSNLRTTEISVFVGAIQVKSIGYSTSYCTMKFSVWNAALMSGGKQKQLRHISSTYVYLWYYMSHFMFHPDSDVFHPVAIICLLTCFHLCDIFTRHKWQIPSHFSTFLHIVQSLRTACISTYINLFVAVAASKRTLQSPLKSNIINL